MFRYIIKRLAYGIAVLVAVIVIITSIIYSAPVDPTQLSFGQRSDEATLENKRKELGLDQPLYLQLGMYLRDVSPIALHVDSPENQAKYEYTKLIPFGKKALVIKKPYLRESYQTGAKVSDMLWAAVPKTAILALSAIFLATLIGVTLGVVASMRQNSWFDNSAVVTSVLGYSLPSYVTAIILALVFGYLLSDYTGLNIKGSIIELDDFGDEKYVWKNLILPTIALGIRPVAIITQLTRSAMLDVLSQDYIRTAKAKGLSRYTVVIRHALRNALNPVVTAISGWFAALLAGAFFVENVFSFKGLGDVTVTALLNFDIPVVLGAVLFTAAIFVCINILVDLLYGFLDPRIRVQ